MSAEVERWGLFEAEFKGPAVGDPFADVTLEAEFAQSGRRIRAPGFYDGEGVYRVRFMPDQEGEWSFRLTSNAPELDGQTGGFLAVAPSASNHGPVRVHNERHFAYADGTPYFPFGTTCYAWTHQPLPLQAQTLETMRASGFNKLRMGVFPKHYIFNTNEPLHDVYQRDAKGELDFDRPNVVAFRHFETQVAALRDIGVEADIIIFHPYDRWGYCAMTDAQDEAYLRYLVARIGAFRNVWWSLANEYDFLIDVKPVARWDRFFHVIEENDPARHPKSIHNGEETMNFDHRKPWVDHVCIQNWNAKRTREWVEEWGKPVVNDELEYEGDISLAWGNITAQELTHRFWLTLTRGGYAGHGECFLHPHDELWWAKGGVLRGESWKRIAFLRKIVEEDVVNGLTPAPTDQWPWQRVSAATDGDTKLIYLGEHQPRVWAHGLPKVEGDYEVDVIDAWEMTVTPAKRVPCPIFPSLRQRGGLWSDPKPLAAFGVELPVKPYQAIRIRAPPGEIGMASVEIRDVRKSFGAVPILQGVSAQIADSEFVVLVGPSGCGKSTLLRMVAGLETITSGEIAIDGRVVNKLEPKERDVAMVFQNYALYPQMTVAQNLGFALELAKLSREQIKTKVAAAAASLGLGPLLERYPRQLSGGQRQRVAMGRAIVRDPKVFLFDEPLSNLDAKLRVQVRAEIKALQRRLRTTTIYVTHDQVEAMTMGDKIIVMNGGRIEQIGAPLDLFDRPANQFVATFLGSPAMNLVRGVASGGDRSTLTLADGTRIAVRPLPADWTAREVVFGVRPEHLRLAPDGAPATVTLVEPMGSETHVIARFGDADIVVVLRDRADVREGDVINVAWNVALAHVFDAADGGRIDV